MMKPIKVKADAIHIKASMRLPRLALTFKSIALLVKTWAKMTYITVATAEATTVNSAMMNVNITMGKDHNKINLGRW